MIKRSFLLFLLIPITLLIFFLIQDKLTRSLTFWRVNIKLTGFSMVSKSFDKTKFSKTEELEVRKKDTIVKIAKTEIEDHNKFIEDRKFLFESLFISTTSPYPEVITDIIECPNEFKPSLEAVSDGVIYTLFAGERLNFGVCSKDLVKYHSAYGIFDCKDKGVFEIQVFSNVESEPKTIVQSFGC